MKRLKLSQQFDDLMDEIQRNGQDAATKAVSDLPVKKLKRGVYQPRQSITPDQELRELAASIAEHGILQPVIVRELNDGDYEIIAGERRVRAAELNQMETIPAIIETLDDHAVAALALIENIQRKDLNPIEEAIAYQKLIDEFGLTHDEVAKRVGKPRATISNFLRLLRLTVPVKEWLSQKQLEMGHAKVLLVLEEEQQITAGQLIINRGLSVRQTETFVKTIQNDRSYSHNTVDPALFSRAEVLQEEFGQLFRQPVKVAVKKDGDGSGFLKLNFKKLDDLDNLYEWLANQGNHTDK